MKPSKWTAIYVEDQKLQFIQMQPSFYPKNSKLLALMLAFPARLFNYGYEIRNASLTDQLTNDTSSFPSNKRPTTRPLAWQLSSETHSALQLHNPTLFIELITISPNRV